MSESAWLSLLHPLLRPWLLGVSVECPSAAPVARAGPPPQLRRIGVTLQLSTWCWWGWWVQIIDAISAISHLIHTKRAGSELLSYLNSRCENVFLPVHVSRVPLVPGHATAKQMSGTPHVGLCRVSLWACLFGVGADIENRPCVRACVQDPAAFVSPHSHFWHVTFGLLFHYETWGRVSSCATHLNRAHFYARTQTTCKSSTAALFVPLSSSFTFPPAFRTQSVQDCAILSRLTSDLFVKTMLAKRKSFNQFSSCMLLGCAPLYQMWRFCTLFIHDYSRWEKRLILSKLWKTVQLTLSTGGFTCVGSFHFIPK